MPDIHQGYGLPVGGVVATDPDSGGVVSPGGVGYDINCGVRLMRTRLTAEDVRPRLEPLLDPAAGRRTRRRGARGRIALSPAELRGWPSVARRGQPAVAGAARTSSGSSRMAALPGATPTPCPTMPASEDGASSAASDRATTSLEIQTVDAVYDAPAAAALGLHPGG